MQHTPSESSSESAATDQTRNVCADLHSHTTASDGALSPRALIEEAAHRGVTHLAITDHDTTAGLAEAERAAQDAGVELITGTELTCTFHRQTIHMLGYGVDPESPELQAFCSKTRDMRDARYREMIERLQRQPGLETFSEEEAWPSANTSTLCRPQLAQALVDSGFVDCQQEAFDRWLGDGGVAHVEHRALPAQQAIQAIRSAGGVAVIAHCGKYRSGITLARELLGQGMSGIEVLHPDHGEKLRNRLIRLCERKNCLFTGGSDFHDPDHRKGALFGRITIGEEDLTRLLDACSAQAR